MNSPRRPVVRWHGGKWLLAPWIISHFPAHRIYVEPFGGGGSVLLRKPRSYAEVYNDLDGEIVNLFRVLREPAQACELERLARLTPYARSELDKAYSPADEPLERARRLLFRSFAGFGADAATKRCGFRSNSTRDYKIPAHDWASYPDQIPTLTARLAGVVIENADAMKVMIGHDGPDTLHYLDPPYLHSTRTRRRGEYVHEMTDQQHVELLDVALALTGSVVLSGYANELYDQRLAAWRRVERRCFADGARPRTEVLWINPHASEALTPQQRMFG